MPQIGSAHHWLARLAFSAAAVFIVLALISGAATTTIWISARTWLTASGVLLLFAIYFILDGAVYAARKKQQQ